jgi:hypothetical protein
MYLQLYLQTEKQVPVYRHILKVLSSSHILLWQNTSGKNRTLKQAATSIHTFERILFIYSLAIFNRGIQYKLHVCY